MPSQRIRPVVALVWSSVLFSVSHLLDFQFMSSVDLIAKCVAACIAGVAYGTRFLRADHCLWEPILLHVCNNSIAVAVPSGGLWTIALCTSHLSDFFLTHELDHIKVSMPHPQSIRAGLGLALAHAFVSWRDLQLLLK